MKKILASLIIAALAALASAPAGPAPAKPTKQDILVMKHDLLTLWNMGINSPRQMDEEELLFMSLSFLMRSQMGDSAELSSEYPNRFTNLPQNYSLFFPKKDVERVARLVFNGFLGTEHPEGVFLGAEGWYIDENIFGRDVEPFSDGFLPSYCTVESMMQQADGTLIFNGKMRRFKQVDGTGEILWAAAPFMARFSPAEEGWQLVSFIFTEEAMG
jgi:hypothetical protein